MHDVGGMSAPLSALAVLLLAAALGLYYGLMSALCRVICKEGSFAWALVFASTWTLAELMRGQWFTGFPWGAVGYAHADSWLGAWAPWVGIYGVCWVASFSAALLALSMGAWLGQPYKPQRPSRHAVAGVVLGGALVVLPVGIQGLAPETVQWGSPGRAFAARILQANISQTEKFDSKAAIEDALRWYAEQTQAAPAGLVLAPETAIPLFEHQLPAGYLTGMLDRSGLGKTLMIGMPTLEIGKGYANAVIALRSSQEASAQGVSYKYLKNHLVPFGEFVPPLFRWFTEMMRIPLGDFHRGDEQQEPFHYEGQRLMPNICYEDLFGEEWARNFLEPSRSPTVMVNFSNIAWFGRTIAVEQHLQISRIRAMEFQRPVVRATNSGATAYIDGQGRVQALLAPHQRGHLDLSVAGVQGPVTPYARWAGRWGLWPLWMGCLLLCVMVAVINRTKSYRMGH
jgi:apolipoprotein N-acyltransferase